MSFACSIVGKTRELCRQANKLACFLSLFLSPSLTPSLFLPPSLPLPSHLPSSPDKPQCTLIHRKRFLNSLITSPQPNQHYSMDLASPPASQPASHGQPTAFIGIQLSFSIPSFTTTHRILSL